MFKLKVKKRWEAPSYYWERCAEEELSFWRQVRQRHMYSSQRTATYHLSTGFGLHCKYVLEAREWVLLSPCCGGRLFSIADLPVPAEDFGLDGSYLFCGDCQHPTPYGKDMIYVPELQRWKSAGPGQLRARGEDRAGTVATLASWLSPLVGDLEAILVAGELEPIFTEFHEIGCRMDFFHRVRWRASRFRGNAI